MLKAHQSGLETSAIQTGSIQRAFLRPPGAPQNGSMGASWDVEEGVHESLLKRTIESTTEFLARKVYFAFCPEFDTFFFSPKDLRQVCVGGEGGRGGVLAVFSFGGKAALFIYLRELWVYCLC